MGLATRPLAAVAGTGPEPASPVPREPTRRAAPRWVRRNPQAQGTVARRRGVAAVALRPFWIAAPFLEWRRRSHLPIQRSALAVVGSVRQHAAERHSAA